MPRVKRFFLSAGKKIRTILLPGPYGANLLSSRSNWSSPADADSCAHKAMYSLRTLSESNCFLSALKLGSVRAIITMPEVSQSRRWSRPGSTRFIPGSVPTSGYFAITNERSVPCSPGLRGAVWMPAGFSTARRYLSSKSIRSSLVSISIQDFTIEMQSCQPCRDFSIAAIPNFYKKLIASGIIKIF